MLYLHEKLRRIIHLFYRSRLTLQRDGLSEFILRVKSHFFLPSAFEKNTSPFEQINQTVRQHIDTESLRVCKTLADGIGYVYGMAVNGDIAEFGTMSGRTAVALASSIDEYERRYKGDSRGGKRLWLFDSFKGLPQARFDIDKNSHHVSTGIWGGGTCKGLSAFELKTLIATILSESYFSIEEGWFRDTVPRIPDTVRFALLHIDGDLYESAIDVLESLFSRGMVSEGAAIFFDDYDCNAANPLLGERRAWQEVIDKYSIHYSDMGPYGISSHRFIIHRYNAY